MASIIELLGPLVQIASTESLQREQVEITKEHENSVKIIPTTTPSTSPQQKKPKKTLKKLNKLHKTTSKTKKPNTVVKKKNSNSKKKSLKKITKKNFL